MYEYECSFRLYLTELIKINAICTLGHWRQGRCVSLEVEAFVEL